jgi:hypothetical protein
MENRKMSKKEQQVIIVKKNLPNPENIQEFYELLAIYASENLFKISIVAS